eukprot:1682044-Alexandrium_andersonii.AAC.1
MSWPTPSTAQLHRTTLLDFKLSTTDMALGYAVCACCAREKPRRKVQLFQFPSEQPGTSCPPWWPLQNRKTWRATGHAWCTRVNYIFSTRRYHDRWPLIPAS